ncbi:MAG TPA: hypothetical protein VF615_30040 [Longimicrobiaceae bacterium]|jgi:hypothetical protein
MHSRSLRHPALLRLGAAGLAALALAAACTATDDPRAGRYRAETSWGEGGFHVVDVEVSRRGPDTYVEYSVQVDPPARVAGCEGRAERNRSGQLEFECNDGWNEVRGSFRASGDSAVLHVEQLSTGGDGIGAFYGDHEVSRVDAARGAR